MEDSVVPDSETELVRNGADNYSSNIDPAVAVFVADFLQYQLSQIGYQWTSSMTREAGNHAIAAKAGVALRSLADEFASQFKEHFVEMCEKLDITADTMKPTIDGVADELFSEGIKWARIVALFVFGSELAMYCKNRDIPDLINILAQSLTSYISEKLLPWINDHGGWEGLIIFNEGDGNGQAPNNRWPSAKNLLCLGIGALGAITLGAVFTKS